MDNKKLGILLIIIGLVLVTTTFLIKQKVDSILDKVIVEQSSCFLEDGTCLHEERNYFEYAVSWAASAALIALGFYLIFFDKSEREINKTIEKQNELQAEQKTIVSALEKKQQIRTSEETFDILMRGLSEEERKIIKAVREQDGITQQTLRLRTGLHKSKLSIVLGNLEKKGLIARVDKDKTKQVFLKMAL